MTSHFKNVHGNGRVNNVSTAIPKLDPTRNISTKRITNTQNSSLKGTDAAAGMRESSKSPC